MKRKYKKRKYFVDVKESKAIIRNSLTFAEVLRNHKYPTNGNVLQHLKKFISEYDVDISHFDQKHKQRKYKVEEKKCPVCGKNFKTRIGSSNETTTCSYSCSNSYFRTGVNNGNCKGDKALGTYRPRAFKAYGKQCETCGYHKYEQSLQVHHIDSNRSNNNLDNLIVLCANCHVLVTLRVAEIIDRTLVIKDITKNQIII